MPHFLNRREGIARGSLARFGRRIIDYLAAACFLSAAGLLVWAFLGIRLHRIALEHGENGDYGVLELPELISADTTVLEFSAIRVPSRVISLYHWMRWPIPEVLEVSVRGKNADGRLWEWEHTFLLACDSRGACKPINALRGVILFGCCSVDDKNRLAQRGWIYFRDAQPRYEEARPGLPPPAVPKLVPAPSFSERILIA